jgi:uncharacterized membrane protein
MDPLHLHLALVHLPVVGLPPVLAGWALAWRRGEAFWRRAFELAWTLLLAAAGLAYWAGGAALERLEREGELPGTLLALAERHAIAGRVALILLGLSWAALLQGWILARQGEEPRGPRWAALGLGLTACSLFLAAAWLGGPLGHPQLR